MLVDSLRADFISSPTSGFSFVRSLLEEGHAYTYKAYAHPPTVTMPRVKALVTGGIPSFSDYLNNFQSSEIDQDNIIWQMQRHSKCAVFYGDETWLKLFPHSFTREEGTTSFFVADTVIVDLNVTRNLAAEMDRYKAVSGKVPSQAQSGQSTQAANQGVGAEKRAVQTAGPNIKEGGERYPETMSRTICDRDANWDVMVLHYLGLDHVGHLQGPRSPLMYPKQVEMNGVYERLYKEIDEETLIILSGDHGMNEDGAHGGPSDGETSPALVFASPAFRNTRADRTTSMMRVDQIDVVPTLMTLLGLPTPLNSVGKLIPDLISHVYANEPLDMLRAYELNALQIHRLLKTSPTICLGGTLQQYFSDHTCEGASDAARQAIQTLLLAQTYHSNYVSNPKSVNAANELESALDSYRSFLQATSPLFAQALSEYDDYLLLAGIIGFAVTSIFAITVFAMPLKSHPPLLLIAITAFVHFIFDSFLLLTIGSTLSSFAMRIFISVLVGYCSAHLVSVVLRKLAGLPSFSMANFSASAFELVAGAADQILNKVSSLVGTSSSNGGAEDYGNAICSDKQSQSKQTGAIGTTGLLGTLLIVGAILRPILYSSSSFIEEEHLTFFYFAVTSCFVLYQVAFSQNCDWPVFATISVILLAMRSTRLWNQTGYQGIGKPDVAQTLNLFYPGLRNLLVIGTFCTLSAFVLWHIYIFVTRSRNRAPTVYSGFLAPLNFLPFNVHNVVLQAWAGFWALGLLGTFIYQMTGSHGAAQLTHYGALFCILLAIFWLIISAGGEGILAEFVLLVFWTFCNLSMLLCRYHNVPLLGLWFLQAHAIVKLGQGFKSTIGNGSPSHNHNHHGASMSSSGSSAMTERISDLLYCGSTGASVRSGGLQLPFWIWSLLLFNMGQYAYFSQGNSNSLSSIDIAGAYAGLSGFQDGIVGLFVALLLYAGPLSFQFSLFLVFIFQDQENGAQQLLALSAPRRFTFEELPLHIALLDALRTRFFARAWSVVIYSLFITFQHRGHLFIWTVFAPKLLYEILHSIALAIQSVVYLSFCVAYIWYSRRVKADTISGVKRHESPAPTTPYYTSNSPTPSHSYYNHSQSSYTVPASPLYTGSAEPPRSSYAPTTASQVFSL